MDMNLRWSKKSYAGWSQQSMGRTIDQTPMASEFLVN